MAKRRKNSVESQAPASPADPAQFNHDFRLQTISLKEIVLPLKRAALDIGSYRDPDGKEHVLTPGTLINALVLAFLELPPDRRREVALAAVARLEAFRDELRHPEAGGSDAEDADGDDGDDGRDVAEVAPRPPGAKKSASRKSG